MQVVLFLTINSFAEYVIFFFVMQNRKYIENKEFSLTGVNNTTSFIKEKVPKVKILLGLRVWFDWIVF